MSLPIVLGARAEAACRLLNQTLGLHRTQTIDTQRAKPLARLATPTFDGVQVQRQATFLRMISITEAFCVDRLLDLAETEFSPTGNNIRTLVWDKASTSAVSTWSGTQDAYKSWYDIRPSWTQINQLIEVRNAIAHGLGKLTRIQRAKRASISNKITTAKIRLSGDYIVLEEANLQSVRDVCVDLISEIDGLVQGKTGDVN
ncbi:hypothetical protein [Paenarthrobacter sp. NPDC018779]|uniref:hypothetical protein n=1 Tax=Paenarthrobacter sp. NPDC018779 TaxID=3364375 RepID=UPI0037CA04D5